MAWGGLLLSLLLILLAAVVLFYSRRWQKQSGIPDGRVIYADDGAWFRNDEVLYDTRLRLAGKPDYLVEQEDGLIVPVEVKSGSAPQMPWPGHVLQLIAYCRLVEASFGVRPTHGILQYQDRAFSVAYTPALEQDLLDTLHEMNADRSAASVNRSHRDPRRCNACGYISTCEQTLI
jgi:CRISPR-associated exonuclease Cas4